MLLILDTNIICKPVLRCSSCSLRSTVIGGIGCGDGHAAAVSVEAVFSRAGCGDGCAVGGVFPLVFVCQFYRQTAEILALVTRRDIHGDAADVAILEYLLCFLLVIRLVNHNGIFQTVIIYGGQLLAMIEGIESNILYTCRDGNACQRRGREGIRRKCYHALRNRHTGQTAAAGENALAHGFDLGRNGKAGQRVTIVKSAGMEGCHAVGNCHAGQRIAIMETELADNGNAVFDHNGLDLRSEVIPGCLALEVILHGTGAGNGQHASGFIKSIVHIHTAFAAVGSKFFKYGSQRAVSGQCKLIDFSGADRSPIFSPMHKLVICVRGCDDSNLIAFRIHTYTGNGAISTDSDRDCVIRSGWGTAVVKTLVGSECALKSILAKFGIPFGLITIRIYGLQVTAVFKCSLTNCRNGAWNAYTGQVSVTIKCTFTNFCYSIRNDYTVCTTGIKSILGNGCNTGLDHNFSN